MHWLIGGYIWLYIHRPFEVWPILGDLRIERVYMLFTMAVWLIYPNKVLPRNRVVLSYLYWTLALAACWLASPYSLSNGYKIVEDHGKVAVLFVLLVTTVRDEQSLKRILWFYIGAMFLYEAHSFLEFLNGRFHYRMNTRRMLGVDETFKDPNTFSGSILHAMPFVVPLWFTAKKALERWTLGSFVCFSLLCILLTGSRRAFLGAVLLASVVVLSSKHKMKLIFWGLLLAPFIALVMRDDLQNRYLTIFDPTTIRTEQSAGLRWQALGQSLIMMGRSPLTGVGPSCFGIAAGHGMQSHNAFAQVMGEMGVLGVIGLALNVLMFWLNDREVRRLYAARPWLERDFAFYTVRITWLGVVFLLFMGFGGHNLYRYNWLWYAAFQAIALQLARARVADQAELVSIPQGTPAWQSGYAVSGVA